MPKIKVKETVKASPNGVLIKTYEAGETYDMPERLADIFLANGWGTSPKTRTGPSETKDGE